MPEIEYFQSNGKLFHICLHDINCSCLHLQRLRRKQRRIQLYNKRLAFDQNSFQSCMHCTMSSITSSNGPIFFPWKKNGDGLEIQCKHEITIYYLHLNYLIHVNEI